MLLINDTHMSRAASTNMFPAVPECQAGTLNLQKLTGETAWDVVETLVSERRVLLGLHHKPKQQVQGAVMMCTKWSRGGLSVHHKEIIWSVTMTVLQYLSPQEIIMYFTSLNCYSRKWNKFRTLKSSHLGSLLQFHFDGGEGSVFWG